MTLSDGVDCSGGTPLAPCSCGDGGRVWDWSNIMTAAIAISTASSGSNEAWGFTFSQEHLDLTQ